MNRSPLVYDRNGELCALCLQHGPHAEKIFSVEFIACHNPLCKCHKVTLQCSRPKYEPAVHPVTIDIILDLAERKLAPLPNRQRLTPEASSLAEELVNEMGAEDWQDLYKRFYLLKQAQTETTDWKGVPVTFPLENMSDPSLMLAYKEIFPWGNAFDFVLEQEHWLVDDQYCVNPERDCQDAIFAFLHLAATSEGRARITQEIPPARYVASRGAFEPLHPPWMDTPSLETLVHALREAHPALDEDIRNRHHRLRTLYRAAIKRDRPKRPLPSVQHQDILPNDRCPCGSGKKFKKCCGRTA